MHCCVPCGYVSNTLFFTILVYIVYSAYSKHRGEEIVKPGNKNRPLGDLKSRKNILLSATRINDTTKLQGTSRIRKVKKKISSS